MKTSRTTSDAMDTRQARRSRLLVNGEYGLSVVGVIGVPFQSQEKNRTIASAVRAATVAQR
jgi:hypothetical protein